MNLKHKSFLFVFVAMFQLATNAVSVEKNIDRNEMYHDISATFRHFYAPIEWKLKHFSWDLDAELVKLEAASSIDSSMEDFHKSLKQFFQSTRDYHTSIWFANNGISYLPISIKYIQGKFYLSYIAPGFPGCMIHPGDEITKIGGQDVQTLALSLIGNINNPSLTDWALASKKLTLRMGVSGDPLESGPIMIEAKRDEENIFSEMVWNCSENEISFKKESSHEAFKYNKNLKDRVPQHIQENIKNIQNQIDGSSYKLKMVEILHQDPMQKASNPMSLGKKESYLPKLGDVIVWESEGENPWDAYIYLNADKKLIGFIRIASYSPDDAMGGASTFIEKFGETINRMNEMTDMLVIDQLNNPGGNVLYLYALASILTKEPLATPHHRFTIDSSAVWDAYNMIKQIDAIIQLFNMLGMSEIGTMYGYPVDIQFFLHMKSYYQFITKEWARGKTLTDPYFLYGVDYIRPNPMYQYTKPILLLINELDFSGGDFFPEIVRGNKRVTLMGTTTAGAGGYVLGKEERNQVGVLHYSYTSSLAYKASGDPLENLGIAPDIEYVVSPNDLAYGFNDYKEKINETVTSILNKK